MRLLLEENETPVFPPESVANIISEMIKSEWDTVAQYNGVLMTLQEYDPEVSARIKEIISDEYVHIGQLEDIVQSITPAAIAIDQEEPLELPEEDPIEDSEQQIESLQEAAGSAKANFEEYCQGKIEDLGKCTYYYDADGEEYDANVIMLGKIRGEGSCSIVENENDPDVLTYVTEKGEYASSPMISPATFAALCYFDKIDKEFYELILANWEDLNLDELDEDDD